MKKLLTFCLLHACWNNACLAQSFGQKQTPHAALIQLALEEQTYALDDAPQLLAKKLALAPTDAFRYVRTTSDIAGGTHVRYAQYYRDLPVDGALYIVHARKGRIENLNGHYEPIQRLEVSPSVSERTALALALRAVGAKRYDWQQLNEATAGLSSTTALPLKGQLVIASDATPDLTLNRPTLAWKFAVHAVEPASSSFVYIDAQSGKVLGQVNQVADLYLNTRPVGSSKKTSPTQHRQQSPMITSLAASGPSSSPFNGPAQTAHHGTRTIWTDYNKTDGFYFLHDYDDNSLGPKWDIRTLRSDSVYFQADYTDLDNNWYLPFTRKLYDGPGVHWCARKVDEFFRTIHQRDSYDDMGGAVLNIVPSDVGTGNASGYVIGPGNLLAPTIPGTSTRFRGLLLQFGLGIDIQHPMASIDVVAHEYGHGLNQCTAGLGFNGEPGILNEALSDIWGACLMGYIGENAIMWDVAERVAPAGQSRPMDTPKVNGFPDTYLVSPYDASIDPHYNITVISHWFYLLSEGGKGVNGAGDTYSVQGIGWETASKIVYLLETSYLLPTSNFCDANEFSLSAAAQLYGFNSPEYEAVGAAWRAVNVLNNCGASRVAQQTSQPELADEFNQKIAVGGLYPNPVSTMANIALIEAPGTPIQASIYNSQGRLVKILSLKSMTTTVDLEELQPGFYYLRYEEQGKARNQTFRIER